MSNIQHITIVGLGVIGGSFAKAIRKHYGTTFKITAIETDAQTLLDAKKLGVIDDGETQNTTILQQADLIILCLYPLAELAFFEMYGTLLKPGAIVTDVAGVKSHLITQLHSAIPPHVELLCGHPMAGREKKGFAYSSAEVFERANYLLTPTPHNRPATIEWFKHFIKTIGFKRITIVTPQVHDEMIAHTSQLSHVLAVSLINSDITEHDTVRFIGDSYRDLTRIANMNDQLWAELFKTNRSELLKSIDSFETQLHLLKQAIQTNDLETMSRLFQESTRRRLALEQADLKQQ